MTSVKLTFPQTITTPAGETMVVLPKADYDRLVALAEATEDAADLAAHNAAMANPEGRTALTPEESAEALKRARERQ